MSDAAQTNWISHENKLMPDARTNYFIELGDLCTNIVTAVNYVNASLRPGLPKSLYQLMLFNYLSKRGFYLEIERSSLNASKESCKHRELIVINNMLFVECVVENRSIDESQKRMIIELNRNNYEMAVLINFGTDRKNSGITNVFKDAIIH